MPITYKTDPYKNASYWPEGKGALTNVSGYDVFSEFIYRNFGYIYRLASNFNMNWENISVEGMKNYLDRTIRQTTYTLGVVKLTDVR